MIITKLQGGIGNQLFQWATTYSLASRYKTNYAFELSYFFTNQRPLLLHKFSGVKIPSVTSVYPLQIVHDDFIFKNIQDNSFLSGYWQSEKYFIEYKKEILEILSPTEPQKNNLLEKYPILLDDVTSIHVRRGDYVNLQNIHPLQSIDYYKTAIQKLNAKSILVFSDDLDWCRKLFTDKNYHFFAESDEIAVLHAMSLCKNNIIANSSFSWWGAWINLNTQKRVIAPKMWFGENGPKNWQDIYCDNWEII